MEYIKLQKSFFALIIHQPIMANIISWQSSYDHDCKHIYFGCIKSNEYKYIHAVIFVALHDSRNV